MRLPPALPHSFLLLVLEFKKSNLLSFFLKKIDSIRKWNRPESGKRIFLGRKWRHADEVLDDDDDDVDEEDDDDHVDDDDDDDDDDDNDIDDDDEDDDFEIVSFSLKQ